MISEKDQIDVMIDFDSNIDKLSTHIKDLDTQIKTMQNNITKASNNQFNQQKGLILNAQQKIKLLQAELASETSKLSSVTKLKQQAFMEELKYNHKLSDSVNSNANTEIVNIEKISKAKRAALDKEALEAKRASDKSFRGELYGSGVGTTIGHKFLTTMQYAAVGTAIYGVASATMALGQAALEADLNMRTMSAVLGLTINQAKLLDEEVRKLGETYGGTTNEIEQVALALGRAGVKTQDITKATEITLQMARLTGDTFEQSASAVISFQQVFGNTTSIQSLGDKLAYVANQSRLSTQDIGTLSNYALAAAKDVGLTEDAVGGLAAAFSNAGVNASTIGTQIRRFTTLLTDNSEAVTSFFNEAGVSQEKLALQISRGGADSNKAMMEFAKTIQGMDAQKFTKLTGQMDILAANSLALIRNNADNINKYMTDLQNGVKGQLESVKVITEAYKVDLEGVWNGIKNSAIDSINDTVEWFDNRIDVMYYSWVDLGLKMNKVGQEALTLGIADTSNIDKRIEKVSDMYNLLQMSNDLKKAEQRNDQATVALLSSKILAENKRLGIVKDISSTVDNTSLIENRNTENLTNRLQYLQKNSALLTEAEKIEKGLVEKALENNKQKKESVKLEQERTAAAKGTFVSEKNAYENIIKLASSELSVNKQLSSDTQKLFNSRKDAYNSSLVTTYNNKLLETSEFTKNLFKNINISSVEAGSSIESIGDKLRQQISITSNDKQKKIYEDDLAVLTSISNVHGTILEIKKEENTFGAKINSINDRAESLAKQQEAKAQKAKELQEKISAELLKHSEYEKEVGAEVENTLIKSEERYRIQTSLVALAYENYIAVKGTTTEEEYRLKYATELTKYYSTQATYLAKQAELDEKRKALSIDLNSGLSQAIEGEQVRLGIIKKATDSEYEKLRVKIEQGKLDDTLVGNELIQAERRLEELRVLQTKKKDIHTLAMEYQREITEQETIGYMAAKAGLNSLESGMMNFFDITSDGWLDWHSLATSVLTDIYKQLLQQLVVKQLVSGIAGGISSGIGGAPVALADGGSIPTKGYALGGMLSGGTGIRDDIYLGSASGTRVFAMGGEFITRKSSVNDETKGTLDYINKTGAVPSQGTNVSVPVKINIENQSGTPIDAELISQMTKKNSAGEEEQIINVIIKRMTHDSGFRNFVRGGR